jgi:hypothetical protein
MRLPRLLRFALPMTLLCGVYACSETDTTTAPGALASLSVDAPDSATSGQSFDVRVVAQNIGVSGIHNGHVDLSFPAPLVVSAVDTSPGTSATFTTSSVSWSLGTLDSNTNSVLHVTVTGTLAPGAPAQTLTILGTLTADGIGPTDAVAQGTLQLNP